MKTRDLLKLPDLKLALAISTMKGKECEKHARNYTKILGIEFEEAIMHATHAAMFSQSDEPIKLRTCKAMVDLVARRLSENSARSEDCEKLRLKIADSEENSGAI